MLFRSVLGVQELGEVQTYDIEVEEVHEFFADGFVSHNSAIWAGLSWRHADVFKFLTLKDWPEELRALKAKDFTFPMPMELTNISVDYDTEFSVAVKNPNHPVHLLAKKVWRANCHQAFSTAEPGMAFNWLKDREKIGRAHV